MTTPGLELNDIAIGGTPDSDGEVDITVEYSSACWSCGDGEATQFIGREDAQNIIAHLTAVFQLEPKT